MYTEGNRGDLLPQVAFAPVVLCPRAAQILFDDTSVTGIGIALESTERIYSGNSQICKECRNRSACKSRIDRGPDVRKTEHSRPDNGSSLMEKSPRHWPGAFIA